MEAALADAVLVTHFAFVAFMVFGLVMVPIGGLAGWAWVREPWWRWAHLTGMGVVALQAALGQRCFLTVFEGWLRRRAGAPVRDRAFVVRLLDRWLFLDVDEEALWPVYIVLFGLLLAASLWVRPRRHPWWPAAWKPRGGGREP